MTLAEFLDDTRHADAGPNSFGRQSCLPDGEPHFVVQTKQGIVVHVTNGSHRVAVSDDHEAPFALVVAIALRNTCANDRSGAEAGAAFAA
jgi:hypothetical protein